MSWPVNLGCAISLSNLFSVTVTYSQYKTSMVSQSWPLCVNSLNYYLQGLIFRSCSGNLSPYFLWFFFRLICTNNLAFWDIGSNTRACSFSWEGGASAASWLQVGPTACSLTSDLRWIIPASSWKRLPTTVLESISATTNPVPPRCCIQLAYDSFIAKKNNHDILQVKVINQSWGTSQRCASFRLCTISIVLPGNLHNTTCFQLAHARDLKI